MSRSSKKKPFIAPELIKRVEAMNKSGKKEEAKSLMYEHIMHNRNKE